MRNVKHVIVGMYVSIIAINTPHTWIEKDVVYLIFSLQCSLMKENSVMR